MNDNAVDNAVGAFEGGANCSQSVFSAFAEQFGLGREQAMKIAVGFGGGMGHLGMTCGAVTGALMALGLKFGPVRPDRQAKQKTYDLVREFIERFRSRNGSIVCKDLIGFDLSIPAQEQQARDEGAFKTICPKLVQSAAEIIEEMT